MAIRISKNILALLIGITLSYPMFSDAKIHHTKSKKTLKKMSSKEKYRKALAKKHVAKAKRARAMELAKLGKPKRSSYFPEKHEVGSAKPSDFEGYDDSDKDWGRSGPAEQVRESIYSNPVRDTASESERIEFEDNKYTDSTPSDDEALRQLSKHGEY
jgi:hypothetical protein